ncbi:MAG TPA: helix-hairpin-helix domain-containing protein [bacterium]|nr:helix-hairpin-helix domain-containing protein [bacterium]
MDRLLTGFHKIVIVAVLIMLAGGAGVRLYYTYSESDRVGTELEQESGQDPVMLVHVKGAVRHPGVVAVGREARVLDAIQAAGGFANGADRDAVNLAGFVDDGQEISVPYTEINAPEFKSTLKPGEKIDLNIAGPGELERIPGIGPAYADRIIDLRNRRGPYRSIEEIMLVQGIGEGKFKKICEFITVGEDEQGKNIDNSSDSGLM